MSYLEFSARWNYETFDRFLQGYHANKHGLGIFGFEYLGVCHYCPQDAPNLGFEFKTPDGGVKSFSAKSYRRLAKMLTEDKDVMMAAVQVSWGTLRYASRDLQNDKDVVLAAVKRDPFAIEHASKELKEDYDVVLAAVNGDAYVLKFIPDSFLDDDLVMRAAVSNNGFALKRASPRLRKDLDLVRLAVEQQPCAIIYAPEEIQRDPSRLFVRDRGVEPLDRARDARPALEDLMSSAKEIKREPSDGRERAIVTERVSTER